LFAGVDSIGVTKFATKTAEKEEEENMGLRFFFKRGHAHPVFNWEFSFFCHGKTNFLGGYNFKTG